MQIHLIRSLASASGCLCAMMSRDLPDLHNRFPTQRAENYHIQSIQTPIAMFRDRACQRSARGPMGG